MARAIVVNFGGEVSRLDFTKVEREKLYGRKVRMIVDGQEKRCQPALLTRDGSAVIPPGCTASLYVDDELDALERADLKAVDAEGKPVPVAPSTLDVEQPLQGPVDAYRLLAHQVSSVYQLSPVELGEKLRAGLKAGGIFETTFNYREDYEASPAFLLENENGIFVLVASPLGFEPLRREAAATLAPEPEAEEGEDDLDFSMM